MGRAGSQASTKPNKLVINHDGSDEDIEHWELPCSIQRLSIYNLITLSNQHLKSLTSLQSLHIDANLSPIQSQGQISSFSHLTSLQTLHIWNLQSLSESALPSSLSHLTIIHCPNLQSLSESALPSSLSTLSISGCPLLTTLLEFDKGEYWPQIAHIPTIEIDWEYI